MSTHRKFGPWAAVLLVALGGLTACTYDAAVRQLSPPEQAEFFLYHHRLSGAQTHTYLAQASAAERTAYLRTLGVVQRFQALDPLDQEAVRSGWPRVGMSAEALLFVGGALLHRGRCPPVGPLALSRVVLWAPSLWQPSLGFWESRGRVSGGGQGGGLGRCGAEYPR